MICFFVSAAAIEITDGEGKTVSQSARDFSSLKKSDEIRIRLPELRGKKPFDLFLEVTDLNTGKNDILIETLKK